MGCAILPHLKSLVEIIEHGLTDEQQKVRGVLRAVSAAFTALVPNWTLCRLHSFCASCDKAAT